MPKILDELCCASCDRKLRKNSKLYDTAWSGVYWCGRSKCAVKIMEWECRREEFDPDDPCNHAD